MKQDIINILKRVIKKNYLSILLIIPAFFILSGCNKKSVVDENNVKDLTQVQEAQQPEKTEILNEERVIIEEKEEIKTESIPFKTVNQDDSSLEKGKTKTIQEGRKGTKELKYKITYTIGTETGRELISENITIQPVDKIVAIGTKEKTTSTSNKDTSGENKSGTTSVKTKIATFNIDCSPSSLPEEIEISRQKALDYVQKLRNEGENIIDVREEKCRFVIIMEDK